MEYFDTLFVSVHSVILVKYPMLSFQKPHNNLTLKQMFHCSEWYTCEYLEINQSRLPLIDSFKCLSPIVMISSLVRVAT